MFDMHTLRRWFALKSQKQSASERNTSKSKINSINKRKIRRNKWKMTFETVVNSMKICLSLECKFWNRIHTNVTVRCSDSRTNLWWRNKNGAAKGRTNKKKACDSGKKREVDEILTCHHASGRWNVSSNWIHCNRLCWLLLRLFGRVTWMRLLLWLLLLLALLCGIWSRMRCKYNANILLFENRDSEWLTEFQSGRLCVCCVLLSCLAQNIGKYIGYRFIKFRALEISENTNIYKYMEFFVRKFQ